MMYSAQNIDTKKFIEALKDSREFQLNQCHIKCAEAWAFFSGYDACVENVMSMFQCSNYEKEDGE